MTGVVIAAGCVLLGAVLTASAIAQLRSGATLSGRGGPRGPITRQERPGYFWFLFWMRIALGPVAALGGLTGLAHLT